MAKEKTSKVTQAAVKESAWNRLLDTVSIEARRSLSGQVDEAVEEEWDLDDLSLEAKNALRVGAVSGLSPQEPTSSTTSQYYLVEYPNGEYPVVKMYKTPEAVAKRLSALAGSDVTAHVFYGSMLSITQGPQRYLYLPDGIRVLSVPLVAGVAPVLAMRSSVSDPVQEDGFLGPPEFLAAPATE